MTETPIEWLFARQRFGVKPGLERVRALMSDLGDPQTSFRTVLVGGTNGKGTTASAIAACLQEHAHRMRPAAPASTGGQGYELEAMRPGAVGLFTSPHLEHVAERFVIDGAPVDEAELCAALLSVMPHAERREATFFEIATVVAARLFAAAGVQTAVFEVGLGGRWDATNVLEPDLSVITGVGLDHTDILGTELSGIALDKAGILRPGVPAITGATGVAGETIAAEAERVGAPLWRLGVEIGVCGRSLGWDGRELWIETPVASVHATTSLLGEHQERNLAVAAAAALRAGVGVAEIEAALPRVRWPGRLERFELAGRWVVLDGAHNPEAAAALVSAMHVLGATPYTLVVGVGADKDVAAICRTLAEAASVVVATRAAHSPRASRPATLAELIAPINEVYGVREDAQDALDLALERTPADGTVLIAGSLYLVGELRSSLMGREREGFARWQ